MVSKSSIDFPIDQEVQQFLSYIEKGDNSSRAKAEGKNLLVVIGNTGSGKSTTINYLEGCSMERFDDGQDFIIRVKPNSKIKELMKIGHSIVSETFIPQIEQGLNGFCYMDCPGFFDNRGPLINIANIVNFKNAVSVAKSVKVLILVNFHKLVADRNVGIKELAQICSNLFGCFENFIAKKESVLIAITHIRENTSEYTNLDRLKKIFMKCEENQPFKMLPLLERITTFDPLDKPLPGGILRNELLKAIDGMPPIDDCQDLFSIILNAGDKEKLEEICKEIKKMNSKIFSRGVNSLTETDFKEAAKNLKIFEALNIIKHKAVSDNFALLVSDIRIKFNEIIADYINKCSTEDFIGADNIYVFLEKVAPFFGTKQINVDFPVLLKYRAEREAIKRKREEREEEMKAAALKAQKAAARAAQMQRESEIARKAEVEEYKARQKAMEQQLEEEREKIRLLELEKERIRQLELQRERERAREEKREREREREYNATRIDCSVGHSKGSTCFKNRYVSEVYVKKGGFFYEYRVNAYVKESCTLWFTDAEGDCYKLWVSIPGWHYVDYNSNAPRIVKIEIT